MFARSDDPHAGALRRALLLALAVSIALPSASALAVDPVNGPIVGSDTSTLATEQYGKPNQSRVWYNAARGRWDGLVPKNDGALEGSDHYIVTDLPGAQVFTATELEDRDRALPDAFWDEPRGTLVVLGSHPTTSRFWLVHYDPVTDSYGTDPAIDGIAVPGIAHDTPNHPAAVYVSPNGHVWVAVLRAGALLVQHSVDRGRTWTASAITLDAAVTAGVTTWNHFVRDGTTYVGLFAAENALGPTIPTFYYYWTIDENADPGNLASWSDESAAIPPLAGGAQADDHAGAARDDAENQYFVVKTQEGNATAPLLNLYKRTPAGLWSQYTVTETQETPEQSRPSLIVDRERATLTVYMSDTNAGRGNRLEPVPLSALDGVTTAPLVTLFSEPGKIFTDVITPRQPVDPASGVVVVAHNGTDQTVWWADGTSGSPEPQQCALTALTPVLTRNTLKWRIKNVGTAPVTIGLVALTWPDAHGMLREVKSGTKRIFVGAAPPPTVELVSFVGSEKDRRIDVGKEREVRFTFQRKASTTLASFAIRLGFGAGCEVTFDP